MTKCRPAKRRTPHRMPVSGSATKPFAACLNAWRVSNFFMFASLLGQDHHRVVIPAGVDLVTPLRPMGRMAYGVRGGGLQDHAAGQFQLTHALAAQLA